MKSQKCSVKANVKIDPHKLARAQKIITELQQELPTYIAKGFGPFLAAIYDARGHLVAKAVNTVVFDGNCQNHAEMNAIRMAEQVLNTYDLSKHNLSLYVTAEPCMMCLGCILWSGIKEVYYGVSSRKVQSITGFDEGFKPNWLNEFKRRGIVVYGHIVAKEGEKILQDYVDQHYIVYKVQR